MVIFVSLLLPRLTIPHRYATKNIFLQPFLFIGSKRLTFSQRSPFLGSSISQIVESIVIPRLNTSARVVNMFCKVSGAMKRLSPNNSYLSNVKNINIRYLHDIPSGNLPYFDHSLAPNHQFCIFHLDQSEYYPARKKYHNRRKIQYPNFTKKSYLDVKMNKSMLVNVI